jgi:hypothetical protein
MTLTELEALENLHKIKGEELFSACKAKIYPCDALAFSILDRSLKLCRAFRMLTSNSNYAVAMAVLRMQLDNLLRFYGVITSLDPHVVANQVIKGKELRKLKSRSGKPMKDCHLREMLVSQDSEKRKWINDLYGITSGYIHLSNHHFNHFIGQSPIGEDGKRLFSIGDDDEHIPDQHKVNQAFWFQATSDLILGRIGDWADLRGTPGIDRVSKDLELLFPDQL